MRILRCAQNNRREWSGFATFTCVRAEMLSLPYNEMADKAYIVCIVRATLWQSRWLCPGNNAQLYNLFNQHSKMYGGINTWMSLIQIWACSRGSFLARWPAGWLAS